MSGTFSDGSGNYGNNENCWWLIEAPGEIRVSFSSFDTESNYDNVSIYRCNCESSSQRILRHSGSLSSSNVYTSSTGLLKVTFTSDGSQTRSGFTGTWSSSSVLASVRAGAIACANCSAGTYSASTSSTCTTCVAGEYSMSSSSTCIACIAGKYTASDGEAECIECGAGKYSVTLAATSSDTCLDCPAGKYTTNDAETDCMACAAGADECLALPLV